MGRLTLSLFGTPEVRWDGRPVRFRTKKTLALFCYLVSEEGTHSRARLAEMLWSGTAESKRRATLRSALASLRHELAEAAGSPSRLSFIADRDTVEIRLGSEAELDLRVLEVAIKHVRGRPPEHGEPRRRQIETLRSGLAYYKGEFLRDFSVPDARDFEYWTETERATWRSRVGDAYARLFRLEM